MTLNEFVQRYNGKGIDEDGGYGFQCVDLVNQYVRDVLGLKRWAGNAVDKWENYPKKDYDRITNTPQNAPQAGDIIIWGKQVGEYGHIAVCLSANTNNFISFDQNWPLGTVCHTFQHSYFGVLGWLRPKANDDMSQIERDELAQLRKFRDEVKTYKAAEFRRDGENTVYQIYGIPSEGHFNFLGNAMANVQVIPQDWPINPGEWASQRERLRNDLNTVSEAYRQVRQSDEGTRADLAAALTALSDREKHVESVEKKALENLNRALEQEKKLKDCETVATVPVVEMPAPEAPTAEIPTVQIPVIVTEPAETKGSAFEDVVISFFKKLFNRK